jgi:hypothetical protein
MLKGVAQSIEVALGMVSRPPCASIHAATPAMIDDSQLSFSLPSVSRKKVTAVFCWWPAVL